MTLQEHYRLIDQELAKTQQLLLESRASIAKAQIELSRARGERHLKVVK